MSSLRFGLKLSQDATIDQLRDLWRLADEGGFDSCWVMDHFATLGARDDGPIFVALVGRQDQRLHRGGQRHRQQLSDVFARALPRRRRLGQWRARRRTRRQQRHRGQRVPRRLPRRNASLGLRRQG